MNRSDMSKQMTTPPSMVRHQKTQRSTKAGGYQRGKSKVEGSGEMKGMAPMKRKSGY